MTRAVIYARFSSASQRDESIEGQIRECTEYAKRKGIAIVGTYTDRALSATTDRRPSFQEMVRDSAHHTFDVVICWKHDRFARNRYDAALYKAKLKANGVSILYAKEDVPEGAQGIIIDSIMEGFAEYYSANLSENVKRGMYENAVKRQTKGALPLGYKRGEDGRYELDENAPIIKRIYEEYTSGKKTKAIADGLNRDGFRTKVGKKWTVNSIRQSLVNPKYKGLYAYKDIYDEEGIPPIVSKEMWDKAQDTIEKRRIAPARKDEGEGYILSGKLFCGLCGEQMTAGKGYSHTGKAYQYYSCDGRRNKNGCTKKSVPKKPLEDKVVKVLRDLIFSDTFINQVAEYFVEWQATEEESEQLKFLRARLAQIETSIANLTKALEKANLEPILFRLNELMEEKTDTENGIARFLKENPVFTKEQIVAFLLTFREGDVTDPRWREYLVRSFVNRIFLYDDKTIIHLNINGEGKELALSEVEGLKLSDDAPPYFPNSNLYLIKGEAFIVA